MNYGYIRVSTDKQSAENQRYQIEQYFKTHSIKADGWIQEVKSGTLYYRKRSLGKLLNKVKKGDMIVCTEISRLGRSLFMIMEILNLCMTKECVVCTIKEGYMLGNDISNKVLAFAFGLSAENKPTYRRGVGFAKGARRNLRASEGGEREAQQAKSKGNTAK